MAHMHDEPVIHHDREVIDRTGSGAGFLVGIAAIVAVVVIGLAVLWAAPWDENNTNTVPNVPDVTDNNGGAAPSIPDVDVPNPDVPVTQ